MVIIMMMITIWIYCGNWKLLNLTPCCKFIQEKSIPWSMEVKAVQQGWQGCRACNLAPVVWRVDNTIHWINLYLVDCTVCFITIICWIVTYPLESAPPLEQPGPGGTRFKPFTTEWTCSSLSSLQPFGCTSYMYSI